MNSKNGFVLVVSVSIMKDDKVLMIQERKTTAFKKWGFPSGRIEHGEDICQAACREVKEETGVDVRLTSSTGTYQFVSTFQDHVIMFHFIGEVTGGSFILNESEILDVKWVSFEELKTMDKNELRDYEVIQLILVHLEKKEYYPIDIVKEPLVNYGEITNGCTERDCSKVDAEFLVVSGTRNGQFTFLSS